MIMKKFIFFAALLAGVISLQAQHTLLSPQAAIKALEIREGKCQTEYVHAFATLVDGVDLKALDTYGVKVNSLVANMATVQIPAKRFDEFVASGHCSYINLGREVHPLLDKARADLGIDYIHQGVNLPHGYDGTGVVVGVIDVGFEYGHPSFYDTTGTTLRIKRVWQQLDTTGNAPAGFSYGSEYTTTAAILDAVTDRPEQGHGSHTAGIAAGCGAPDAHGRRYQGMAPGADIVLVATNLSEPGIFDGIRYIHQYARMVGKPCVINMSLGSLWGPHDGLDDMDVMIENYAHQTDSLVLVTSASNDGGSQRHLHHQFSATEGDTVVRTYMSGDMTSEDFSISFDAWGEIGDEFSAQIILRRATTYAVDTILPVVSSAIDSVYEIQIVSRNGSVYNCAIGVSHSSPHNQRPEISMIISKQGRANVSDKFELTLRSTSANVHLWSDLCEFSDENNAQHVNGDDNYTIGGVGANGDAVISVGSYVTRSSGINADGSVTRLGNALAGDLSTFSSHGPTSDGRVKPDICAPGQYLVSAINAYYLPYYLRSYIFDSTTFGGQSYYYALMQGTSMSSPATAGIVALWLQQNPGMNVDSVRAILHASGRHDRFTGNVPATGSNLWGWGKVDPYGGLPATVVPMYYLDVYPGNFMHGYVTGRGRHPQGTYTVEAFAATGYVFVGWSDGVTDNPRVVNLTSDTVLTALYDVPCDTISEFPWDAVFADNELLCWELFHHTGISDWITVNGEMNSISIGGQVDNWLITPRIIPVDQSALYYTVKSYTGDSMSVVVITAVGDSIVLADNKFAAGNDQECQIDISSYAGQTVRFGFRHHASTGSYGMLALKSLKIGQLQSIVEPLDENLSVRIFAAGGRIHVSGADGMKVGIYDIIGRQVANNNLPNGVYLVRVGDLPARKVVVVR